MEQKPYLIKISGNEVLLEDYLHAIESGDCKADPNSYCAYLILNRTPFLNSSVVNYFFQTRKFDLEIYQHFFEKLRNIDENGFSGFSYQLKNWIEENITKKYFDIAEENEDFFEIYPSKPQRNSVIFDCQDRDKLKFIGYVATCHMKFGASYECVTANEYFEIVEELQPDLIKQLKQYGSKQFDHDLTFYQDSDLKCQANAFAKIDIVANNQDIETYKRILKFINNLLKQDFPRSFSIEFSSSNLRLLDVDGLPICGQNYLFASAVQYPELHNNILEYIQLSQKQFEWYQNLEAEECALPSTFAVFALALYSPQYFSVLEQYLKVVDDGHQSIQQYFTSAFVQKYGINQQTFPLFLKLIRSMQEHPPHSSFIEQFKNPQNLELLLDAKQRFDDWEWSYVLYSIFGKDSDSDRLAENFTPELWEIYLKIREERGEDFQPENSFDDED